MNNEKLMIYTKENVSIGIGPNGCGKSMWLRDIALRSGEGGIAIATSSEHKFYDLSRYRLPRLTPRSQLHSINVLCNTVIKNLAHDDGRFRYSVGRVLEYIGYEDCITFSINNGFIERSPEFKNNYDWKLRYGGVVYHEDKTYYRIDLKTSMSEEIKYILEDIEYKERSNGMLRRSKIFEFGLIKNGQLIPIKFCSSGEMQLLRTHVFILLNINKGSNIYIDEPEASLHPKWQIQYIKHLLDLIHYYDPNLYIATHSPFIVEEFLSIGDRDQSLPIEDVIANNFSVLTPKSYVFNERLSNIIDQYANGNDSKNIMHELNKLKEIVYSEEQRELIDAVENKII